MVYYSYGRKKKMFLFVCLSKAEILIWTMPIKAKCPMGKETKI